MSGANIQAWSAIVNWFFNKISIRASAYFKKMLNSSYHDIVTEIFCLCVSLNCFWTVSENHTEGFFPLKCTVIPPNCKDLKPAMLLRINFPALSNSVRHKIRAGKNFLLRKILLIRKTHFLTQRLIRKTHCDRLNLFHHLKWLISYGNNLFYGWMLR